MGYIFDFHDAQNYEKWRTQPEGRFSFELENQLQIDLLNPQKGETVLDIGCGTGNNLQPFLDNDIQVTGIDASPYMLDIASQKLGNRVDFYRGFAEDLPFDDNSFNHACLVTTLEFVEDPAQTIAEACRVAKDRVFLGVLNRYAIKGIQRRVKGIFSKSIYNHAQFYSVWELKQILRSQVGDVPVEWKTVCQFPHTSNKFVSKFEQNELVQRCPFGAFVGIVITLVPRFKTRPLALKYSPKHSIGVVGLTTTT
jgi:ubiquinone/menaquinone biosynthesis C-methylase UbiE